MRFEVDSAQVSAASNTVMASANTISTEVDAMMRNLTALQNSWQGQASSAFQDVALRWRGTQEQVHQSLDEIQRALSQAGQQYSDVEQATARMFS